MTYTMRSLRRSCVAFGADGVVLFFCFCFFFLRFLSDLFHGSAANPSYVHAVSGPQTKGGNG